MKIVLKFAIAAAAMVAAAGSALAAGELNIYNWGNYTSPEMLKKFEDKYQVKVNITDYDSNDTALAKVRAGGHGFDLAVPSASMLGIWVREGLIQEHGLENEPEFKNIEDSFLALPVDPGRKYSLPYMWGTFGVSVNTKAYSGDINSWKIILDPPDELKGKINVLPEMQDVIFAAVAYLGGQMCTGDKEILKKARDLLATAKPNWMSMEYSTIEAMAKGDMKATSAWNGDAFRQRLQNPDIKYGFPREGTFIWQDTVVLLKEAKNVENAKLFLKFILEPENAAMGSAFTRYANAIKGSEAFMPEDMKGAPELGLPDEMKPKTVFSVGCPPEVTEIYTKIWTELFK